MHIQCNSCIPMRPIMTSLNWLTRMHTKQHHLFILILLLVCCSTSPVSIRWLHGATRPMNPMMSLGLLPHLWRPRSNGASQIRWWSMRLWYKCIWFKNTELVQHWTALHGINDQTQWVSLVYQLFIIWLSFVRLDFIKGRGCLSRNSHSSWCWKRWRRHEFTRIRSIMCTHLGHHMRSRSIKWWSLMSTRSLCYSRLLDKWLAQ